MALELRQEFKLTQQLIMTPQLQQALKILQLPRLELAEMVQTELKENAVLEEIVTQSEEEEIPKTIIGKGSTEEASKKSKELRTDEINWDSFPSEFSSVNYNIQYGQDERPSYEQTLTKKPSLADHLTWQIRLSDFSEIERYVGAFIIGNIDEDGYLKMPLEEVAKACSTDQQTVERVLRNVQDFDPPGIAARDLQECLLIQARYLQIDDPLVEVIIKEHLKELENNNYPAIAKKLGVTLDQVIGAAELITHMEPKPGRLFSQGESQYIIPDVYVYKIEGEYVIVLNEDGLPKLRISPFYRQAMAKGGLPRDTVEYIRDKMRSAIWLIKSIHQRQRTIYRVTKSIMNFQREFLDRGIEHLKPLVLKDVADDVEMSESTISRVVTNKYVQTSQGLFELKYFFNSKIQRYNGNAIASESVKNLIKQMIQKEDPRNPLSDQEIVEILAKSDIDIARRTVAKYRNNVGVLPSNKRRKLF